MRKFISIPLVFFLALLLSVSVFADVLPPSMYSVTVGSMPIRKFKSVDNGDSSFSLVNDGTVESGRHIDIINIVTVNGQDYGVYQTRQFIPESERDSSGRALGNWESHYVLMSDVYSLLNTGVTEFIAETNEETEPPTVLTNPPQTAVTTAETTASTTKTSTTSSAPETTTAQPISETETETDTQPAEETTETLQTETTSEPETTVLYDAETDAQTRSPKQIILLCLCAAVVLTLTAVVTLVLIRRKRNRP